MRWTDSGSGATAPLESRLDIEVAGHLAEATFLGGQCAVGWPPDFEHAMARCGVLRPAEVLDDEHAVQTVRAAIERVRAVLLRDTAAVFAVTRELYEHGTLDREACFKLVTALGFTVVSPTFDFIGRRDENARLAEIKRARAEALAASTAEAQASRERQNAKERELFQAIARAAEAREAAPAPDAEPDAEEEPEAAEAPTHVTDPSDPVEGFLAGQDWPQSEKDALRAQVAGILTSYREVEVAETGAEGLA
jgi:hypothetical protein